MLDPSLAPEVSREIELRCTLSIELATGTWCRPTRTLVRGWCEFAPPGYHAQSRVRISRVNGPGGETSGSATLTYKSTKSVRKLTDSLAVYESDEHTCAIGFDRALSMLASD